jgi:hypothetical protein
VGLSLVMIASAFPGVHEACRRSGCQFSPSHFVPPFPPIHRTHRYLRTGKRDADIQDLCRYRMHVCVQLKQKNKKVEPSRRGLVVSSPPVTEEIGAVGREFESRQGIHRMFKNI